MSENGYLRWLSNETKTNWWHDSAIPDELDEAITNGAVGTTTNPLLVKQSLFAKPEFWKPMLADIPESLEPARKAEEIARIITTFLAKKLLPVYEKTNGLQGYVCAQVNPVKMGDADIMLEMARRLTKWAPNICVKLPVTNAGLEVLEECIAEGMTVAGTASFTVPQVLAIGERHMKGLARARLNGVKPGQCFAVVMVGRLDEYIRDVAHDRRAAVSESDIIQCGTAVMKRAYAIFNERGYEAILMPAAMRGMYHVTSLSGSAIVISIAPKIAEIFLKDPAQQLVTHIDEPVDSEVIRRLMNIPEFVRAYEPDGMKPEDFITYGVTQRTMTQFIESGWNHLESYKL
ncbi:MAG: transaldolase family protein [Saccharofermentanales bacterium]